MAKQAANRNTVFVAGGVPTYTYITRSEADVERELTRAIAAPHQIVSLAGPSKSGKTVLCQHVLHGGALLLIFNARTQEGLDPLIASRLQGLAWCFALGLISAFFLAYMALRYEIHMGMAFSEAASVAKHQREQTGRQNAVGVAFILSAALFVVGLVFAITQLRPASEDSDPAPAAQIAAPATSAATPQEPPATESLAPEVPDSGDNPPEQK